MTSLQAEEDTDPRRTHETLWYVHDSSQELPGEMAGRKPAWPSFCSVSLSNDKGNVKKEARGQTRGKGGEQYRLTAGKHLDRRSGLGSPERAGLVG